MASDISTVADLEETTPQKMKSNNREEKVSDLMNVYFTATVVRILIPSKQWSPKQI